MDCFKSCLILLTKNILRLATIHVCGFKQLYLQSLPKHREGRRGAAALRLIVSATVVVLFLLRGLQDNALCCVPLSIQHVTVCTLGIS